MVFETLVLDDLLRTLPRLDAQLEGAVVLPSKNDFLNDDAEHGDAPRPARAIAEVRR